MGVMFTPSRRGRALAIVASVALSIGLIFGARTADAAAYVGAALTDLKPEDKVVVAHPQPVQLLFEFHTKGAPNGRATKALKATVLKTVQDSGLFSQVTDDAAPNGAILSVVIDNIADVAKAEGQGFATGATFFVKGSNVKDNYTSTLDFVSGPSVPKITRSAKQFIITQIGMINSTPQDAVKIGSMMDAAYTMTRQIVANPLNEIAKDPAFPGATLPATPPVPAAPVAPSTPSSPRAAPAPAPPAPAQPVPATPSADPTPKVQ